MASDDELPPRVVVVPTPSPPWELPVGLPPGLYVALSLGSLRKRALREPAAAALAWRSRRRWAAAIAAFRERSSIRVKA
jgi:hypothetical protein